MSTKVVTTKVIGKQNSRPKPKVTKTVVVNNNNRRQPVYNNRPRRKFVRGKLISSNNLTLSQMIAEHRISNIHFHSYLHSVLDPSRFVNRAFANTSAKTAICHITSGGSFVYQAALDTYIRFDPGNFFTSGNTAQVLSGTISSGASTWTTGAGTTLLSVAAPFASINPSLEARLVGCEMRVIPTGNNNNTAGSVIAGMTSTTQTTYLNMSDYILLNFDQVYKGNADKGFVMHYFPHTNQDYEFLATGGSVTALTAPSGWVHLSGMTSGTNFSVYVTWVIEYLPNSSYRPFVDISSPRADPSDWAKLNEMYRLYPELIIGSEDSYERAVECLEGVRRTASYSALTTFGASNNFTYLDPMTGQTRQENMRNNVPGFEDMVSNLANNAVNDAANELAIEDFKRESDDRPQPIRVANTNIFRNSSLGGGMNNNELLSITSSDYDEEALYEQYLASTAQVPSNLAGGIVGKRIVTK